MTFESAQRTPANVNQLHLGRDDKVKRSPGIDRSSSYIRLGVRHLPQDWSNSAQILQSITRSTWSKEPAFHVSTCSACPVGQAVPDADVMFRRAVLYRRESQIPGGLGPAVPKMSRKSTIDQCSSRPPQGHIAVTRCTTREPQPAKILSSYLGYVNHYHLMSTQT